MNIKNDPNLKSVGEVVSQVDDIEINKKTMEYHSAVFKNIMTDERVHAEFPEGVNFPVQSGPELKASVVYHMDG
jgi:hypothetical protein